MDVPRLEAFLEVARLGSMRAASRSLHLGQPALSARIATLEGELGTRLFERTRRGVRLTSAGSALLPHAERVMESVAAGRAAVGQVELGDEGELAIAAVPAVNASLVPELVARFRRFHPGVHFHVQAGSPERVAELVVAGSAHLGLVHQSGVPRDPRIRATSLYEERSLLAARSDHPFTARGPVTLARLADATLILHDRGSDDHQRVVTLLREAEVVPYSVIEVDSVDTAQRLVARGIGVAWLPSTTAAPDIEAGTIVALEVAGVPAATHRVVALERSDAAPWVPVRTLRRLLSEAAVFLPGALPIEGQPT